MPLAANIPALRADDERSGKRRRQGTRKGPRRVQRQMVQFRYGLRHDDLHSETCGHIFGGLARGPSDRVLRAGIVGWGEIVATIYSLIDTRRGE